MKGRWRQRKKYWKKMGIIFVKVMRDGKLMYRMRTCGAYLYKFRERGTLAQVQGWADEG